MVGADEELADVGVHRVLAAAPQVGATQDAAGQAGAAAHGQDAPGLGPHHQPQPARAGGDLQRQVQAPRVGHARPAGHDAAVLVQAHVDDAGVAHEGGHEFAVGLLVHRARRAHLQQAALVHHRHVVAQRHRLAFVVGDVGHGQLQALLQRTDLVAHLAAQAVVQVGQRLVQQHHLRLQHQRTGQRHAVFLAAGQLAHQPLPEAAQAHHLQHRGGALACAALVQARGGEAEAHVAQHVQVREQGIVLEQQADVAVLGVLVRHVAPADEDAAGRGFLQPRGHAQQRGLAAARRPQQGGESAARQGEAEVAHGAGAVLEALGHAVKRQLSHGAPPAPAPRPAPPRHQPKDAASAPPRPRRSPGRPRCG